MTYFIFCKRMKTAVYSIVACLLLTTVWTSGISYAAYGWWGWSTIKSSVTTSTGFLKRDVCPDGDRSLSYYDGSCGDYTAQSASEQPSDQPPVSPYERRIAKYRESEQAFDDFLQEKREMIDERGPIVPYYELVLPIRYRLALNRIDRIMEQWLDNGTTTEKAKLLVAKIEWMKMNRQMNDNLRLLLSYIQDKAVSLMPL